MSTEELQKVQDALNVLYKEARANARGTSLDGESERLARVDNAYAIASTGVRALGHEPMIVVGEIMPLRENSLFLLGREGLPSIG